MGERQPAPEVDWSLTTWEGSRREQLRRWSQRSLEEILRSLEEMQELSRLLQEGKPDQ
jgi:hypothetical protein